MEGFAGGVYAHEVVEEEESRRALWCKEEGLGIWALALQGEAKGSICMQRQKLLALSFARGVVREGVVRKSTYVGCGGDVSIDLQEHTFLQGVLSSIVLYGGLGSSDMAIHQRLNFLQKSRDWSLGIVRASGAKAVVRGEAHLQAGSLVPLLSFSSLKYR